MATVIPSSLPFGPQGVQYAATKSITFTGGAGAGAVGTVAIWTVTGMVEVYSCYGFCLTSLVGATATISVGTAGNAVGLIPQATATNITTATPCWGFATPQADVSAWGPGGNQVIVGGNIIATVGTAAITSGVLRLDMLWRQISPGATVV